MAITSTTWRCPRCSWRCTVRGEHYADSRQWCSRLVWPSALQGVHDRDPSPEEAAGTCGEPMEPEEHTATLDLPDRLPEHLTRLRARLGDDLTEKQAEERDREYRAELRRRNLL